jgi:hypothetical protein
VGLRLVRAGAVLRGRRSVYLSMAGFASVVLTFFVVERLSGLHAFLDGAG